MEKNTTNNIITMPHVEVEILSIKDGRVKFCTHAPGVLFERGDYKADLINEGRRIRLARERGVSPSEIPDSECLGAYEWHDKVNHVITAEYVKGAFGTFVKFAGKYLRYKDDKGKWQYALDENGKKIWINHIRCYDPEHPEIDRLDYLRAILTAAVDVKEGRFSYRKKAETAFAYAITENGFPRVKLEDIEPMRAKGVNVVVRPQSFSCLNCMNCISLYQSDEAQDDIKQDVLRENGKVLKALAMEIKKLNEGPKTPEVEAKIKALKAEIKERQYIKGGKVNDTTTLRSRSTGDLTDEGQEAPRFVCLIYDELLDAGRINKEFNDELAIDRTVYTDAKGFRRKLNAGCIPVKIYQHVKDSITIQDILTEEFEEPDRDVVTIEYDTIAEVQVDYTKFVEMSLEPRGFECPFFHTKDVERRFYEKPKSDKCAVMYPVKDSNGIYLKAALKPEEIKERGTDRKFIIRCGKFEASYYKKSVLELQMEFLTEIEKWIDGGADTSDVDRIRSWIVRFNQEKPVSGNAQKWAELEAKFFELI